MLRAGRSGLVLLALLAIDAAPPTLDDGGLGPVRVGMTLDQASSALGARLHLVGDVESSSAECDLAYRGQDRSIRYMMTVGRIVRIDVKDSRVKTRRGIGIGATIAAIRKAYPHIKSHPNPHGNEPIFEWNTVKGTAGLIFETNHGHVSNMAGGHYPALGWIEECG